ncbi:MAG TPA: MaoC/PaaZ C-terminal domain-containing protein, partial [Burkholderiales bacterium]|nr:MaoC/PaaZ C-terminal domain-containing protein [Burkholderiales bacterium]
MQTDPASRVIGKKAFGADDQQLFASVSGDRNPMHMDAVAARRLITGRQVVHGVHVLLTAIECWQSEGDAAPVSIGCNFNNPVSVGDEVVFTQSARGPHESAIEATVNGLLCSQIVLGTEPGGAAVDPAAVLAAPERRTLRIGDLAAPLEEAPAYHLDKTYLLEPVAGDFSTRFPRGYRRLGARRFAAIAALSRFVGMICPGLHSIFSSLNVRLDGRDDAYDAGPALAIGVRKYDTRVGLFDVAFRGCISGTLTAFLRPPPHPQPSVEELRKHVAADEFRGTRSLVIGGSRGLGEMTAKILAAGGGDVIVTYAAGLDDAKRLSDEINAAGASCAIRKFDLTTDRFEALDIERETLDAVYFFATPRIYRKKLGQFEPALFQEFFQFYIGRFHDLCASLEASAG